MDAKPFSELKNIGTKPKFRYFIFLAAGLIIGYVFCFYVNHKCNNKYRFLNKELNCESKVGINKKEYTEFKEQIVRFLDQKKAEGDLTTAAVYFRDLQSGPTFGINEKENFVGASLLKVPLLLTYLNLAEDDPAILAVKLGYNVNKERKEQIFKPKETLKFGEIYTVYELLEKTVYYSDNASFNLLIEYLDHRFPGEQKLLYTYQDLGLLLPKDKIDESISIKSYASMFRQLFNATYLSADTSEVALKLMTKTFFMNGLRAGIPEGIPIAHKFGERTVEYDAGGRQRQLHDCGIVYYPGNPYLLCIMTKGDDYDKLTAVIREVSERVYLEVQSRIRQ